MSEMLKIRRIEKEFIIEPGKIFNINIENSRFYYHLLSSLLEYDEDVFIYSEEGKIKSLEKNCLIISNIFNLDANSKKILTSLYKRIANEIMTDEDKEKVIKVNDSILELLNKISLELNLDVDYSAEIDIQKILSIYDFSFKVNQEMPLDKVVTFIKANLEIGNYKFVISNNLLPLFNDNELEMLSKELELLGVSLINLTLVQTKRKHVIDSITIDDDLCEF